MKTFLAITLLLLSGIAITPNAEASTTFPEEPATLIAFITQVKEWQVGGTGSTVTNFDTFVNLTMTLSPDDPDQTNGDFEYNLVIFDDNQVQLGTSYNISIFPIQDRPTWVWAQLNFASTQLGNWTLGVTANNTASGNESPPACAARVGSTKINGVFAGLPVRLRENQTITQCGIKPDFPAGLAGLVTQRTAPGVVGTVNLSWPESANDTDSNWTYIILGRQTLQTREGFGSGTGPEPTPPDPIVFSPTQTSINDTRFATFQPAGLGLRSATFTVIAFDTLTRWRSEPSCVISLELNAQFSASRCADAVGINPDFDDGITGGSLTPEFPLVNVTAFSDAMGIDISFAAWVLGFIIVGAAIAGGFMVGGILLGTAIGTLGLGAAVALNLIAPWIMVIIFMAAALIIILPRGGQE